MRRTEKLMKEWIFTYKDGVKTILDLPHTWNAIDGQDGGDDYFKGKCVYKKTVGKPEFSKDEKVYLQFHVVNASAKVVFNGKTVCVRDGGYSTFRMEVTELLKEENHILVEVDNSVNDRVYPQKADFTFNGGIYRDVEFLIVSNEHFDLDYYGGSGMKYDTDVNGKDARVNVSAYTNKAAKAVAAVTRITLLDAVGKVVADAEGNEVILAVKNVHLWDGLDDPYLYTLKASLEVNGKIVDEISYNCGIRFFEFSPKNGFHLNGRHYPLHGVSRHQDFRGVGNAVTKEHHDRDMELIMEVGENTVRLAHSGRPLKKQMPANHHVLNDLCHEMDPKRPTTLACFAMCPHWHPVAYITDLEGEYSDSAVI